MYIIEYGFWAQIKKKGIEPQLTPLENGVPEAPVSGQLSLTYNGKEFASIKENNDHLTVTLHIFKNKSLLTIEKNRLYSSMGRDRVIISTIIYGLLAKHKDTHQDLADNLQILAKNTCGYLYD